jgi:hypothetical protein
MMLIAFALFLALALHGLFVMLRLAYQANRGDVARNAQRLEVLGPPRKRR